MKKITKIRTIIQYLSYVIRQDYLATIFTKAKSVNALVQLGKIQVPKRASGTKSYSFAFVMTWPFYDRQQIKEQTQQIRVNIKIITTQFQDH